MFRKKIRFPELSYANPSDHRLKQWFVRRVEGLSGRDYFADLYEAWRNDIVGKSQRVMGDMMDLIQVGLLVQGEHWPPKSLPDTPLVIVANHPFGIGDGIAVLAMAEQLGRPFRVIINNDLLKVPEIRPYSLPINFEENREALQMNLQTRREAVRLLKEGVTIVVFPAGGVATARKGFGRAEDLPWKLFPAKMIQAAGASVIPIYFDGQNGRLFHLASRISDDHAPVADDPRIPPPCRQDHRRAGRRTDPRRQAGENPRPQGADRSSVRGGVLDARRRQAVGRYAVPGSPPDHSASNSMSWLMPEITLKSRE